MQGLETATRDGDLAVEIVDAQQPDVSLGRRIFNRRTAISLAFSLGLLYFLLTRVQIDFARTFQAILGANPWYYVVAFGIYYLAFPVRAYRWRQMLVNAGCPTERLPRIGGLGGIIFLSWFVNCLVPAKLGDVYRAYLLKRATTISLTKAGGTIVAERIVDFAFVLIILGLTGMVSFRGRLPDYLVSGLEVGTALAVLAGGGLLLMWLKPALVRFFLPARLHALYGRFEEGALGVFGNYPTLFTLTVLAWLVEALRLFFVIRAIGLVLDERLLIELALVGFIALVSSLFTAPPGLPAGLGYVEASIVAALMLLDQPQHLALSVALLDRSISYVSLVVLGAIYYLLTRRHA